MEPAYMIMLLDDEVCSSLQDKRKRPVKRLVFYGAGDEARLHFRS